MWRIPVIQGRQRKPDDKWEAMPLSVDQTSKNKEEIARLHREQPVEVAYSIPEGPATEILWSTPSGPNIQHSSATLSNS